MPTSLKWISPVFTNVNEERGQAYSNYNAFPINWSSPDNYQLVKHVGRGKYSDVFLGVDVRSDRDVIVKVLKPVRKRKIRREIKVLENLRGHPNIITLIDVTQNEMTIPALIFEHINCSDASKLSSLFGISDIQYYMNELAKALYFAHSNGIIHRDVKPQNIIIDFSRRILKLIDWGLAEFYHPGIEYNVRVASRYYKSPELLINYQFYDYSMDIWSFGVVMAALIFQKEPFFHGSDNRDQLVKIVSVLGTNDLRRYCHKFQHRIEIELEEMTNGYQAVPLEHFIDRHNNNLAIPSAVALVKECLQIDHSLRITSEKLLNHEFFKQSVTSHTNNKVN